MWPASDAFVCDLCRDDFTILIVCNSLFCSGDVNIFYLEYIGIGVE